MNFVSRLARRVYKRPQISLLALMVLIAVCAVLIQFVILPAYRRSARNQILARITELNGVWADLGKEPLRRRLLLQGERVDAPFLDDLADVAHLLPELVQLDLMRTAVSDESWNTMLRQRSNVSHYVLFENAITDGAIKEARVQYPKLTIEERRPDTVATKLAKAPIPPAAIISMVHDQSSNHLLFGSGDGRLHRMEVEQDGSRVSSKKHGDWVFDVSISPSGKRIATAGGDNRLAIHDAIDFKTLATGKGHAEDVHGVVWMDDQRLVTTSDDKTLKLWQLDSKSSESDLQLMVVASLSAHDKQIPRVVKVDGDTILTVSRDHTLRRWAVSSDGFQLLKTYRGHSDDCMDASVSPDGEEFASVSYDGQLILWQASTGKPILQRRLGKERLFSLHVDWSKRFAVIGSQSCVQLISLDTGQLLRRNTDQTFVARIISCNDHILTSDGYGRILERNAMTLETKRRFQLFEGDLDVFSADGFQRITQSSGKAIPSIVVGAILGPAQFDRHLVIGKHALAGG